MRTCLQDTMTCHQCIGQVIELTTAGFCKSSIANHSVKVFCRKSDMFTGHSDASSIHWLGN